MALLNQFVKVGQIPEKALTGNERHKRSSHAEKSPPTISIFL
jgi:hypothetical protein